MMRLLRITVTPPTSVSQRNGSNGDADVESGNGASAPAPAPAPSTPARGHHADQARPRRQRSAGEVIDAERTRTRRSHESRRDSDTDGIQTRQSHVANLQQSRADDKRQAIRMALDIITAVSKGLYVPESRRSNGHRTWRVV